MKNGTGRRHIFFPNVYTTIMHPIDRRRLATHVYSILRSLRKTAILLQVGHTTVHRWLKYPERKKYHREPSKQTSHVVQLIRTAVANDPFITCSRLQSVVKTCIDVELSRGLIHSVLKTIRTSHHWIPSQLESSR